MDFSGPSTGMVYRGLENYRSRIALEPRSVLVRQMSELDFKYARNAKMS